MYTEELERGQRFWVALRMGVPIFLLTGILLYSLLTQYFEVIPYNFIIVIIGSLGVAVYFQFYLIYQAFDERITDSATHTFTGEYFTKLFSRRIRKRTQTLILFSVNNLPDINQKMGLKKANQLLYVLARQIDTFLQERKIERPAIYRVRGGDFVIMIEGERQENRNTFDLLSTKIGTSVINNIEISSSGAIIDSTLSDDLNKLIDRLFELQFERRKTLEMMEEDNEKLGDIERRVFEALEYSRFSIMGQKVHGRDETLIDISIKLVDHEGKLIHQKRFLPIISREGIQRRYDIEKIKSLLLHIDESINAKYAVHIACETLRSRLFLDDLSTLSKKYNLGSLAFIIEEQEYYSNIKRFNALLQSYRSFGITIIIDALGANHTSQLYMKDLDADIIRFEGSYGKKITDEGYLGMVEGLNVAAKRMGIRSWIRMIEDEESLRLAKSVGIDLYSGNYLDTITSL